MVQLNALGAQRVLVSQECPMLLYGSPNLALLSKGSRVPGPTETGIASVTGRMAIVRQAVVFS